MNSMRLVSRAFSTTLRARYVSMKTSPVEAKGVIPSDPGYSRVAQLQKKFCEQDGLLVWQKGGMRDSAAYMTTLGLSAAATSYVVWILWTMSWPKKTQD